MPVLKDKRTKRDSRKLNSHRDQIYCRMINTIVKKEKLFKLSLYICITFSHHKKTNTKKKKKMKNQHMPSSLRSTLLALTLLSFTFGANAQVCSEAFLKLAEQKNISDCKRLRTLGAEFAWNLHGNGSGNSTVVDILFGAKLNAPQGWIGWGVNPGRRPQMVGTKAIVAVKRSDGTWVVDTYNITKEIRNGCNLLPSKLEIVLNKSFEQEVDNLHTMYVRLSLPSEEYNVTRLNHVWQVGYDIEGSHPHGHPKTLRNVDSKEVIDLTDSNGRGIGQYRVYLKSVRTMYFLCFK